MQTSSMAITLNAKAYSAHFSFTFFNPKKRVGDVLWSFSDQQ
jgi:hypothetical protein